MSLSDKKKQHDDVTCDQYYDEEDVREAVKELKEKTRKVDGAKIGRTDNYVISVGRIVKIIDEIFGDLAKEGEAWKRKH